MEKHAVSLRGLWVLAAIAAASAPGCGRGGGAGGGNGNAVKPAPPSASQPPVIAAKPSPPLSEAECRDYAQSVIKAIDSGDLMGLNKLIDWDAIFQTMAAGVEMAPDFRAGVFSGIRKTIDDPERGLTGQFLRNVKNGGKFTYLRARQNHGRQVVLFRMLMPGEAGGMNYLEFAPVRGPGGSVRASDIYVYLSGEFVSETLRRALLPVVADQSRSVFDKLLRGEQDYIHDFPDVGKAGTLVAQGKGAEALPIYRKMRPETRKQKVVLLGRLGAAQSAGDDTEYAEVIEEFRKNYPNDPCLDMISIDGYMMKKDYDGVLRAMDQLDKAVGGDAYIDSLRAGVCQVKGDLEGARRFARKAVEADPTLLSAHWELVGLDLKAEDYKEALETLKLIDRRFTMTFGDLTKEPSYAGFVKSPQYREWLDYLKSKNPAAKSAPPRTGKRPIPKPGRPGAARPRNKG